MDKQGLHSHDHSVKAAGLKYTLSFSVLQDRFIIDRRVRGQPHKTVKAHCWIEAKQALGFELSVDQEIRLEAFQGRKAA